MGRDWQRKTAEHGTTPSEVMELAVNEVLVGKSTRAVAREVSVKRSTLQRYVAKKLEERRANDA